MDDKSASEKDKQFIWHPYTQEKYASLPIVIEKGEGAYLYDENGNKFIDAISSWWVNAHGHANPFIIEKISIQLKKLEQVIFAGFTHLPAINLAERLLNILPSNQKKIFYSDNGSTAVEVALKMAIQYWSNTGIPKSKILALKNGFHGDTFGSMSVSGRGLFSGKFNDLLFDVEFIDVPTKGNEKAVRAQFNEKTANGSIAAFIFEPLVQGAAGMVMYEPGILDELLMECAKNDIITIADEVMTGFYRTGRMFACDYLSVSPDIFCLSKALTGGFMPLGVTSCSASIFEAFYSDDPSKTLYHGHSYTANPLACTAALAGLDLLEERDTLDNIIRIRNTHYDFVMRLRKNEKVIDARSKGVILAIELKTKHPGYLNKIKTDAISYFIEKGIIIRPLGNILYVLPPYCISENDMTYVYQIIEDFISTHEF